MFPKPLLPIGGNIPTSQKRKAGQRGQGAAQGHTNNDDKLETQKRVLYLLVQSPPTRPPDLTGLVTPLVSLCCITKTLAVSLAFHVSIS